MKGQTAMEYLMTYGWVILIILIVALVLAYYGIYPKAFLEQDKTILEQNKTIINTTQQLCNITITSIFGSNSKYICDIR